MTKIIAFANQKGGVGKTTSAINVAASLGHLGKKVLLIDMDPQGNCTSGVGVDREKCEYSTYQVLLDGISIEQAAVKTAFEGLWCVPATMELAGAEIGLSAVMARESILKKALSSVTGYDYILMDCPPSLGLLTLNGLCAAKEVIVPMQCEYFALEGLSLLVQTVNTIRKGMNPELKIGGIVFTMYDSRIKLANEVVRNVTHYFKDKVFRTVIPRNVAVAEAPSHCMPINLYRSDCLAAAGYKKLAEEVLSRV